MATYNFTAKDDAFIMANYSTMKAREIARILGREVTAVQMHIFKVLKLQKRSYDSTNQKYSTAEIQLINDIRDFIHDFKRDPTLLEIEAFAELEELPKSTSRASRLLYLAKHGIGGDYNDHED